MIVGYEVIGIALFGVAFLWLSVQKEIDENWRKSFFYLGFIEIIMMLGFSLTASALLRGAAIMAHALVLFWIVGMELLVKTFELWMGTR